MLQVSIIALWLFVGHGLVIEDSFLLTRIPGIIGHVCPGSDVCSSNRSSESEDDISFAEGKESCCAGSYIHVINVLTVVIDIILIRFMRKH
jgi:hypothetical protein